tara:strand:- start:213 stop:314 length:102 start_codon:yes stop_codon:yes gene_type:complete
MHVMINHDFSGVAKCCQMATKNMQTFLALLVIF